MRSKHLIFKVSNVVPPLSFRVTQNPMETLVMLPTYASNAPQVRP
eukprot:CAMPEP_0181397462 /NCGR_PEP_ID=MMETSP1110-20121109/497_1 /TAXON_ID=174948 /ORGANISM="Symbiodinium sp., Strain CCMP421" /LENGTH=44 /DNA_ID= /DNA_START= /DNA_END= /DNA_ORIENTATION=